MHVDNRRLWGELGSSMFAEVATPRLHASYALNIFLLGRKVRRDYELNVLNINEHAVWR